MGTQIEAHCGELACLVGRQTVEWLRGQPLPASAA